MDCHSSKEDLRSSLDIVTVVTTLIMMMEEVQRDICFVLEKRQ